MIGLKLDCLNPNIQGRKRTLVGSTSDAGAIASHGFDFCSWYTLHDGRCPARAFKDMNGEPTSFSKRSSVTEHGMAYRARAQGARSAKSTRGRNAPPGHTGEPCTGGSGTGGWRVRCCEVREMRNAAAARALVRGDSEKATGELIDTETVTISSEGAVIRSSETWSNPRGWEPKVQCEPLRTCWTCGCGQRSNSHPQGA